MEKDAGAKIKERWRLSEGIEGIYFFKIIFAYFIPNLFFYFPFLKDQSGFLFSGEFFIQIAYPNLLLLLL
jgi:hypothetical protein